MNQVAEILTGVSVGICLGCAVASVCFLRFARQMRRSDGIANESEVMSLITQLLPAGLGLVQVDATETEGGGL